MGLGKTNKTNSTYLTLAGGYIWNTKVDSSHPDYATQAYEFGGEEKERSGAQYQDLTGKVVNVLVRSHDEYGDNLNVTVESGGELYILSAGIDSRYAGDLMKMLLIVDFSKPVFIRPYDFITSEKKRAMGISFRQDGEKLDLKIEGQPTKEADWFKSAQKRDIKRFFEDVTDYFKDRVKMEVIPQFEGANPQPTGPTEQVEPEVEPQKEEEISPVAAKKTTMTPLKMKKVIREYMKENYVGVTMPTLTKDQLVEWCDLCILEEELPIDSTPEEESQEEMKGDIDSQLDAIMGK